MLSRRQRILTTLEHREPDRVPIGVDQTAEPIVQRIFAYYGVANYRELYDKTGVDGFSPWRHHAAAHPIYVGPPRPFIDQMDSIDGFWGKVREHVYPLASTTLDAYRWPQADEFDYSHLAQDLLRIRASDMTSSTGHAGVGFLHHVQMRSYDHVFLDLMDDAWMADYMARNRAFFIPYFEALFEHAAGAIDIVRADEDLGGQERMLLSPAMWRRWYKPLWRDVFAICKRHGVKIWMHSCGYCRPLIDDFLEIGVDILNPLPPYVKDSDPAEMKAVYGDRLAFHGGVDQMNVLVRGTPADVRAEVKLRIAQLAPGGGYILDASQGYTEDVPLENIVALFESALDYGHYS